MKKKTCPCGGTEFKATRIMKMGVVCDGKGVPIDSADFSEDRLTYTCQKCGTQFESLEDLISVQQPMTLTIGFPGETPTKLSVASDGTVLENVKEAIAVFYKNLGNDLSKTEGIHPVCLNDGEDMILYGLLCVKPDSVSIKIANLEDGMPSEWEPVPLDATEESSIGNEESQNACKEVLLSMEALTHRDLLCGVKVVKDWGNELYCFIIKPRGYIFFCPSVVRAKILAEAGSFVAVDIPNDADYTFMFSKQEFEEAVIRYKGTGRFASDLWPNYSLHKRYSAMKDNLSYGKWLDGYLHDGILAPITREDVEAIKWKVYPPKRTLDPERILPLVAPVPKKVDLSVWTLAHLTLKNGGFFVYDEASDNFKYLSEEGNPENFVHDEASNRYFFKHVSEEEHPDKWFRPNARAKILEEEADKVRLLLENINGDYLLDLVLTPEEFEKSLARFIH